MCTKPLKIGFIVDPIATLDPLKDSSLALMRCALSLHGTCYYTTPNAIQSVNAIVMATWSSFDQGASLTLELRAFDLIFIRLEPPVCPIYQALCQLLEPLESKVCIVNRPSALLQLNEKLITANFPQHCPPTCVSASLQDHLDFLQQHSTIVVKPLDGFGGRNIHRLNRLDPHPEILLTQMTHAGTMILSQAYLPEIREGDTRLFFIDGQLAPVSLIRIPDPIIGLGNLAQGATAQLGTPNAWHSELAALIGPWLKARGILFAGVDCIGHFLTEINITCPTCLVEVHQLGGPDLCLDILTAADHGRL